jgi:hypothetical protein
MLFACRLAGLSALEALCGRQRTHATPSDDVARWGLTPFGVAALGNGF